VFQIINSFSDYDNYIEFTRNGTVMIMYTKIMEDLHETAVMFALVSVVFGLLMLSMRYLYGMDFSIVVPMLGRVYVSFFVGMMIFNAYDWIRFARRRQKMAVRVK